MLLLERGFGKGDFFASLLPLTSEHIFLEYACFRIGAIFVPLDLRLTQAELMRSLTLVQPAGFAFVQDSLGSRTRRRFARRCRSEFPLKLTVQFAAPEDCADGAIPAWRASGRGDGIAQAGEGDEDRRRLRNSLCRGCGAGFAGRWRAGDLYHRLDRFAQAGAALASQHLLPGDVPESGVAAAVRRGNW